MQREIKMLRVVKILCIHLISTNKTIFARCEQIESSR